MMNVTLKQVRGVSAVALVALLLGTAAPLLGLVPFDADVATARMWNSFDSVLPPWAVLTWAIASVVAAVAGLIGMFWLWPLSRWLLAAYVLTTIAVQPFLGLAVFSSYEAAFAGIFGASLLWLVGISFWSPFADQFRKRKSSAT